MMILQINDVFKAMCVRLRPSRCLRYAVWWLHASSLGFTWAGGGRLYTVCARSRQWEERCSPVRANTSEKQKINVFMIVTFICIYVAGQALFYASHVFTRDRYSLLTWTRWKVHTIPVSLKPISILSSHLRLGLSSGLFPQCFSA
jgi:hypothetical protein